MTGFENNAASASASASADRQALMKDVVALKLLSGDDGKLARQLDTAAHGGNPDAVISKHDVESYLKNAGAPENQMNALQQEALKYLLGHWDKDGQAVLKHVTGNAFTKVLSEDNGKVFDALDTAAKNDKPDGKFGKDDIEAFLKHVKDDPKFAEGFSKDQIDAVTELQKLWSKPAVCNLKEGMNVVGHNGLSDDGLDHEAVDYKGIAFDPGTGFISKESLTKGSGFKSQDDLANFQKEDIRYLEMKPVFDQNNQPVKK